MNVFYLFQMEQINERLLHLKGCTIGQSSDEYVWVYDSKSLFIRIKQTPSLPFPPLRISYKGSMGLQSHSDRQRMRRQYHKLTYRFGSGENIKSGKGGGGLPDLGCTLCHLDAIENVDSVNVPPEIFKSTKLFNQPKLPQTWLE